jgi:rRNA maturation protein Nop10
VDAAHLEQIRARRELESRQLESVKTALTTHEPILREAASYGLNAGEGLFHVNNAKTAVSRKDAVNAAKYSIIVKEIVKSMEKDIDSRRIDRGTIKRIEGAKCDKCGQEALYSYPDRTEKCVECGQKSAPASPAPSAPAQQPAAPPSEPIKKKGFLRW